MSITPLLYIASVILSILYLLNIRCNFSKYFLFFIILILLLISSDEVGSLFFSPEQKGHHNEVIMHISNNCASINILGFESFKKITMFISCKLKNPDLFDFIYKFAFILVSIFSYFQLKSSNNSTKPLVLVILLLIPSLLYGNIRTPLAQLILVLAVMYVNIPVKSYILAIVSSFPHSIGITSIFYVYALRYKINKSKSRNLSLNIILGTAVAGLIVLVYFQYVGAISGDSVYILGKNSEVYIRMGDGATKGFFGLPRSMLVIPTLVLMLSFFFKNQILNKKQIILLYVATLVLAYIGAIISLQVSGRIVGFVIPVYFALLISFYSNDKGVNTFVSIFKMLIYILFLTRIYYEDFRISYAVKLDFLNLPYVDVLF